MSIKKQAISGIKWTSLSSVFNLIIQLTQLAILAHILSPKDFGLMAIVVVVIGLSRIFMDAGISNAIIYKQAITNKQLSTLYWLNILAGILIFLLIVLFSPLIAKFYKEPELVKLLVYTSLSFLIQPFGQQYMIILKKYLKFNIIAKFEIISRFFSFIIAVIFALLNFRVYALVLAHLSYVCLSSLLFFFQGLKYHKPLFYFNIKEIKDIINFGAFQIGERTINYINSQFDIILIGKLLGPETLGVYTIAKNLIMKPAQFINPVITNVTFPIMAQIQDNILKLKQIYLKTILYLSSVNFPIYIALAILAEPIILIFFGDKWIDAIIVLRILAFYGLIRSFGGPVGSLLLAKGRADLGFYWNLVLLLFIPLFIYSGSFYGITGIAFSLLILQFILIIPNWKFLINKIIKVKLYEYLKYILLPFYISLLSGIVIYAVYLLFNDIYLKLIIPLIFMTLIYIFLSYVYNKMFTFEVFNSFIKPYLNKVRFLKYTKTK